MAQNPFPGMDPWLESQWNNVHLSALVYSADQIQPLMPDELFVRIDDRGTFGTETKPSDEPECRHIRISEGRGEHHLVTVIEWLRPFDKCSPEGRGRYQEIRRSYLAVPVNLVEIDLLRNGSPIVTGTSEGLPADGNDAFSICIRRSHGVGRPELITASIRHPLPGIPVPLRRRDPDVFLDLQAVIERCYRNGRHDKMINYQIDPVPPLTTANAKWADELLRIAGRRL